MLSDSFKILNESDIHYWLDWGSLLGIIRDGDLIPYDSDIDLGIFLEDIDNYYKLKEKFEIKGYSFHNIDKFSLSLSLKVKPVHCIPYLDVWTWRVEGNKAILNNSNKEIFCDVSYYKELRTVDWEGFKVKVPKDTENYLSMRYGDDWRTPIRNFHTSRSCGSSFGEEHIPVTKGDFPCEFMEDYLKIIPNVQIIPPVITNKKRRKRRRKRR